MEESYVLVRPSTPVYLTERIKEILLSHDLAAMMVEFYPPTLPEVVQKVEEEYAEHKGKPFYPALITSMTTEFPEGSIYILRVCKTPYNRDPRPVWKQVREVCGATDPKEAGPETIRGALGHPDRPIRYNIVHSPDSEEAVEAFEKRWIK